MGVRFPSVSSTTLVNTALVNAAETIMLTSPPLNLAVDFEQILIFWSICLNVVGASTTLAQVKIRRGTTAGGTQVNVNATTLATPANQFFMSGCYIDTPGAVAGQQYTVTLAMLSATANSNANDGCIILFGL